MDEKSKKLIVQLMLKLDEAETRARYMTGSIDDDADSAEHQRLEATKGQFFSTNERRASYWAHAAAISLNGAISALRKTDAFGQMSQKEICMLLVETLLEEQLIRNWHDKPGRI